MPPPGLQIYLRPRVILTVDLMTIKLIVSCPCTADHLAYASHHNRFIRFQNIAFTSLVTDGRRTDGQTDERT